MLPKRSEAKTQNQIEKVWFVGRLASSELTSSYSSLTSIKITKRVSLAPLNQTDEYTVPHAHV